MLQTFGQLILCGSVGRHICVAEIYLGSFHMIKRTHVCYRRQEFVVAVSVCGACVCVFLQARQYMWCSACVFVRTHTCVLQKPRVRGHASAGCDILIEHVQLPACCTNFCSAWGRRRWMCDHVVSCTHLCCRYMFVLQKSIWGHSIGLRTHKGVTEDRKSKR